MPPTIPFASPSFSPAHIVYQGYVCSRLQGSWRNQEEIPAVSRCWALFVLLEFWRCTGGDSRMRAYVSRLAGQACPLPWGPLECKAFLPPQVPGFGWHFLERAHRHIRHCAVITPAWGMQPHHTEGQLNTEAETMLHTKIHSSPQAVRVAQTSKQ